MLLMRESYTEIIVEEDLLSQVVRELTVLASDQNHVEVTHGSTGRVILAHPDLAEAWYTKVTSAQDASVSDDDNDSELSPESNVAEADTSETDDLVPIPVKRGPGRPRKVPPAPSVSNGEES